MIDIVDVKQAIKNGEMFTRVKGDVIYLENDIGETVEIGKTSNYPIGDKSAYIEHELLQRCMRDSKRQVTLNVQKCYKYVPEIELEEVTEPVD